MSRSVLEITDLKWENIAWGWNGRGQYFPNWRAVISSVVTKAVDAETETKTEAAGFETEAKTEAAGFEAEAQGSWPILLTVLSSGAVLALKFQGALPPPPAPSFFRLSPKPKKYELYIGLHLKSIIMVANSVMG